MIHSYDSVRDKPEGALQFTSYFFNSVDVADLPPHELKLETNIIMMLLQNLDVTEGQFNGIRIIINGLYKNIFKLI